MDMQRLVQRVRHVWRTRAWIRRVVVAAIIAAPPFILCVLLARYAVLVPFWDQWELAVLFEHYHQGTLTFGDFLAPHNEHHFVFPRLIMLGLAALTAWNTFYEIAASVVFAGIGFFLLWLLIKETFVSAKLQLVALGLTSFIFFSPLQHENWLWGWQLAWFLSNLGLLVAVWSLHAWAGPPRVRLVVAAVAATVATYSLGSGLLIWLACVPLFWFRPELKKLLPAWVVIAAIVVASHYSGAPGQSGTTLLFLGEPLAAVVYFLTYVGRPLVGDFLSSLPVALLYITSIALLLRTHFVTTKKQLTTVLLPWLCVGGFALLVAGSTTLSRLGLGVEQAYSSRYTTISSLLLIAVCMLTLKLLETPRHNKRRAIRHMVWGGIIVVGVLVGNNYVYSVQQMRQQHTHLVTVQQCARQAREGDDCLLLLYPDKKVVWPRLQYLRQIHWGGL